MIDLDKKYIDIIKQTINSELSNYKLYIFGSRVKGNAKKYSDIDLAIESSELTDKIKSRLDFLFENSTIPYEIDIINLDTITDNFRNCIINDLVQL